MRGEATISRNFIKNCCKQTGKIRKSAENSRVMTVLFANIFTYSTF